MKAKAKVGYRELSDKYRLLRDLMDNIPDVIYFKDAKGKLLLVNKAHAKGLGLKPEQVAGKTDFNFFSKDRARAMAKDDEHVLKTGKPIIDKIERATRPDGIDNYVSTTKIPRFDEKGKVIGLIGITRDITKRMHVEGARKEKTEFQKKMESLEEINRMKSELISVVSHELRVPLAIVKEAVMIIFDGLAGEVNDKQRNLLHKAKDNIERLKKIIEDLLDMSRIEQGTLRLHYSLVNLNELLVSSSDFFKKLALEKDINLRYDIPEDEVNIFIDAGRITQVVNNLINNAIKFTEQGGTIRIELKIMETRVRIGVLDTGVGIAKDDLSKLFHKFVQVSKVPGADRKGLGLGLSIAKELVNKHGGEIWAESKSGVGSKFYFTLSRFYTVRALDEEVKDRINSLLSRGITVNLINLLIVNYSELKEKTKLAPKRFFTEIKEIIDKKLEGFSASVRKDVRIVMPTAKRAEFSILIPEAADEDIENFSRDLKENIRQYLTSKVDLGSVFIALGLLKYPGKEKLHAEHEPPEFLRINEMYIGAELRRYRRINYALDIELISGKKRELTRSIDISEGGLCFITREPLKTDTLITVKFKLPNEKEPLTVKGRIAWLRQIEKAPAGQGSVYKTGLEFIRLDKKPQEAISKFITAISSQ